MVPNSVFTMITVKFTDVDAAGYVGQRVKDYYRSRNIPRLCKIDAPLVRVYNRDFSLLERLADRIGAKFKVK